MSFNPNIKELLDTMFIKRYCLPCNTDINTFINNTNNINNCFFDNFNHISCFLSRKFVRIKES